MAKKKSRIGKVAALLIVFLFVASIGTVAYWQRGNIQAVIYSLQYSEEERKEIGNQKEAELLQKISEEMPAVQVKPLTQEEEQMLKNGEISQEEALGIIMGESEPAQEQPQATQTPNQEVATPEPDTSRLKSLLAQVYLLKSNFVGQIDGMVAQAKQDHIDGKGQISKYTIAKGYISKLASLETQCDNQVKALLQEIKLELEKTGGDVNLVSEIQSSYEAEKKAKKAEMFNTYYARVTADKNADGK